MVKIILKKLKSHDTIWHPQSRLVFKSKKEKVVIGRLDEDGEEIEVVDNIIDLCDQWKFNICPSIVESEEEVKEEEVEEEEVEEEEVEEEEVEEVEEEEVEEEEVKEEKKEKEVKEEKKEKEKEVKEDNKKKKKKKEDKKEKEVKKDAKKEGADLHVLLESVHSLFHDKKQELESLKEELFQVRKELSMALESKEKSEAKLAKIREHFL